MALSLLAVEEAKIAAVIGDDAPFPHFDDRAGNVAGEDRLATRTVLEALAPYSKEGGPLTVERISFAEGRGNVIITYKGTGSGSIAFVGRCARSDLPPAHALT